MDTVTVVPPPGNEPVLPYAPGSAWQRTRGSGIDDTAASGLDLQRWVPPRTLEETFVPATDYRYPFTA